jgi:2',3'-cyclic-nucleotide 2'-phosphodiesterase (5'-nucleotidase family)
VGKEASSKLKAKTLLESSATMGDYIYNVGYFDLAAGYEFLQEMKTTFGTNFMSSNIVKAGTEELAFIPHKIIEKNGLKIGVFGITTALPATEKAIEVKDYVESAKIQIAELRPQVDLLVMLFNSTRVQAFNAMDDLSEVDYIYLSRETTRTRPEKSQDSQLPLTYGFGIQGKYVGRFDVDIADKTQPIKDVTSAMMTVSIFEQRLNNLQKRDPNQPLEEIYKNNPNVLNMVSQYKDGLTKSKSALTDGLNTSFYSLIPLGRGVASEKNLLAVVDETLKTCNTLDKKGLQSLN